MNKNTNNKKSTISIGKILFKFFFGFLIPFVAINGIIFFIYIQTPTITVLDSDSSEYEADKIKFTINCFLPLKSVKVTYQDADTEYSKIKNTYMINVDTNGSYHIMATAINGAVANWFGDVESIDTTSPKINLDTVIITGNTLRLSIYDENSEINYEKIYATLEDGTTTTPTDIEKSLGTIQFQIDKGNKITVHLEDEYGNSSETPFTIA